MAPFRNSVAATFDLPGMHFWERRFRTRKQSYMRIDPAGVEAETIARVADFTGMRVLEVGSGEGRMTSMLSRQASSVLAIDSNAEAIAVAVERTGEPTYTNVEYMVADVCTIKLQPGEFDAVFLALSL
jgi:ubiquinone/menaquinone biosynthesis C-methylase UbiE